MVFAGLTLAWLLLCLAVLYPIFQTIVLRWWISGMRFGEVAMQSRLRLSQVFAVYARFVGYAALSSLIAGVLVFLGMLVVHGITGGADSLLSEIINTLAAVAAYVAIALR